MRKFLLHGLTLALALGALSACDETSPVVPQLRPVEGGAITSSYGPRPYHPLKGHTPGGHHDGNDFAVPLGSPIRAAMAGTVSFAGVKGGYGRTVMLRHTGGWSTLYGHAATLNVKPGQKVAKGQVIALVGSTGLSTGPHLHYELRKHGQPVDPGPFEALSAPESGLHAPKKAAAKRADR